VRIQLFQIANNVHTLGNIIYTKVHLPAGQLMELNTGDTRYVSGENSYAQWYEPITVFKLGLAAFNICYKFPPHEYFSVSLSLCIYFAKIVTPCRLALLPPVMIQLKILINLNCAYVPT